MYWSRTASLNGVIDPDNEAKWALGDPTEYRKSDVYYQANDTLVSLRPAMKASWGLYIVLACQPVLTILFVLTSLFLCRDPISDGFGLIAILAGAKFESLRLLKGASFSGKLDYPVRMQIVAHNDVTSEDYGKPKPRNEYIFKRSDINIGHGPLRGENSQEELHDLFRGT